MKYLISIILLSYTLFAQLNPEGYLNRLKETEGIERVDLLNKIAEIYRDQSNFSEAIQYAEKALAAAKADEYKVGEINASNILANTYLLSQLLDAGIEFARTALSSSHKLQYKYGIANAFRNIGIFHIYSNQSVLAIDTLRTAVEMFEQMKDTLNKAAALTSLGVANTKLNNIDKSAEQYKEAAQLYSSMGNNYQAAHAYLNLGSIYTTIIGDYQQGLDFSLSALNNFQEAGDEFKAAYARLVIGQTYEQLGDLDTPIKYYSDALEIFKDSGNSYLVINAINNLGEVYKAKREFNTAIEYYEEALKLSKESDLEEGVAIALNNIGECYFQLESYNLAIDYYNQSFPILAKLNDSHKMSISLNNQAATLIKLNSPLPAIPLAERAINLAEKVGAKEETKKGLESLYEANRELGRYKDALSYFIEYEELKDSLINEQRSSQLSKVLAEHKAEQNKNEIELLTKSAELKEAELARQEVLTYLLIALSITLLIFGVIYYIRYTERKAMNKKLVKASEELNEINSTKDLFFSIIAHDLRGPFNSLLGITEILAEDSRELSTEEITNLSKEVNQNARGVFLLLENLLEWSSSQLGKISYNPQKFDLNEVVIQNINLYRKTASVKNIDVNFTHNNNATVYGDKNMLDSVTRNLINNAIKFTPKNGKIDIETIKENSKVVLSVQDSGMGISQEEIDKIFKLGSEVKRAGTENEKGTGLGLVLCKEFVNKNNGTIEVNSEEGKGSLFKVTLPSQD